MTSPPSTPPASWQELRPGGAVVLILIALAGALSVLWLGSLTLGGDAVTVLNEAVAGIVGPLFALYVGLNRYAPSVPTLQALKLGAPRGQQVWAVVLALVIGIALALLLAELTRRLLVRWPLPKLTLDQEAEMRLLEVPHPIFLTLLLVFTGLAEETLFRGLLQPRLAQSIGRLWAFLVTLALSLVAFNLWPQFVPASLLLSGACGLVALRIGSTWVPIASRTAFLATPLFLRALGFSWPDFDGVEAGLLTPGAAIACVVVVFVGLVLMWRLSAPEERLPS